MLADRTWTVSAALHLKLSALSYFMTMIPLASLAIAIQNVGYLQSRSFRIQSEQLHEDTVSADFGDRCIGISVGHERCYAAEFEVGPTVLAVGHSLDFAQILVVGAHYDRELGLLL